MSLTRDPGAPRPARRRRVVAAVAGLLLLAAVVSGIALSRSSDDHPAPVLTVGWGGSEGHPACVYDPKVRTVDAKIAFEGRARRPGKVTVTVTAYADENTSQPVGSSSRSVRVDGTMHMVLLVTIAVGKAPHVDVDGVAACRLSVRY